MKKEVKSNLFLEKKARNLLMGDVVINIIIVVFFAAMFIFVARAESQATIVEQIYAKQIALAIDKVRAGTIIELDISKLYELAEKNNFGGEILIIDNDNNKVQVKLAQGKGYESEFFNNADIKWDFIDEEKGREKLYLEALEK